MTRTPREELEYLKSLVVQLNDKISALEKNVADRVTMGSKEKPEELRMILVGPPGAGTSIYIYFVHYRDSNIISYTSV